MLASLALALAALAPAQGRGVPEPTLSSLARPLYLGAEPPECRALAGLSIPADARDPAVARARAHEVRERLRAGAELESAARGVPGAVPLYGTFAPGALHPVLDAFLFAAAPDQLSEPLEGERVLFVARRVERWAACRELLVPGTDAEAEARARELAARARAGEDFVRLARELSPDEEGGAAAEATLYERGPRDAFLKRAAFQAALGEVFGPLRSPLGFHVGKRVPVQALPEELREKGWIRARALLVADVAPGAEPRDARARAQALAEQIRAGADMAALARAHDDDPGGRARSGDLGWLHRDHPGLAPVLARLFTAESGALLGPLAAPGGWVLLRREL
jgi:parvulin-like peptidyl-prolyl isomerase